ncbi:MAG: tetratricopeptide repeat protein [bacterium]
MMMGFVTGLMLLGLVSAPDLPGVYNDCLNDHAAIFREANDLYEKGSLAEARAGYEFLVDNGAKNGYIHYNLGNTYFRSGQLGKAILEYERSLEYLPRHPDIRHNLEFARNLMVDEELKPKDYGGTLGLVLGFHSQLNLRESLVCFLFVVWLAGIAYAVRILYPDSAVTRHTYWVRVGLVVLLVFGILSVGLKIYRVEHRDRGVVLAQTSDVKTGPDDTYSTAFTLHEGTAVRVGLQRPDWVQIRLANGLTGWLKGEDLGVI